jgi:hypothetical protein
MRKCFLVTFFLCLVLSGCEKWSDYRKKYLGNWEFEVSVTHEILGPVNGVTIFHDTTIMAIYDGEFTLGSANNAVLFNSVDYSNEFHIDKDGKVLPLNDFGWNYDEGGGFEGQNIFRYYFSHQPGGMQHGKFSLGIYGTKK